MIALAPAIALILPRWRNTWGVLLVVVLGLLSISRAYVWASDERLWGEAMRLAPEKIRPRLHLARAVPPDRAVDLLKKTERIAPQNPDVATELARVYLELGRPAEALGEAGRALALSPRDPRALNNRGTVLLAMKQTAAARRDFINALHIEPCLREARENLDHSGGVPADVPTCR
jgi:tetratricopeptide (TPR) repeat protein